MSNNLNKNQLERLQTILGLLRKRGSLNFDEYRIHIFNENCDADPSLRTFSRDIAALRKLGAKIVYRQKYKGFELVNKEWSFHMPVQIASMKTLLLSERVARNFLPSQIRKELRETVDSLLTNYEIDMPEETNIFDFQIITTEFSPQIDSEIFKTIYQAWENCDYVKISYCSITGHCSEKIIAPRVFAWNNGCWYIKALVAKEDDVALPAPWEAKVFALHRIRQAEIKGKFLPDQDNMANFNNGELFNFQKFDEVVMQFFHPEAARIKERFSANTAAIIDQDHNSITVSLKNVSEHTVFPLIYQAKGNVRIIKPAILQDSLINIAKKIFNNAQNT